MAKVPLSDVNSRYGSVGALNANFDSIQQGFENTLSRDGTGPNAMEAPLDMNGNDILNISNLSVNSLSINGQLVVPTGTVVTTLPGQVGQSGKYLYTNGTAASWRPLEFTPAGAGAVTRTVQEKLRDVVSVFDFMSSSEVADALSGTNALDCTAALQAAINYCLANDRDLNIPARIRITQVNIDRLVDAVDTEFYFTIFSDSGGGFLINGAGTMFSTTLFPGPYAANSPGSHLIRFDNIRFECTDRLAFAYVLDARRFLRIVFSECSFYKIRCGRTNALEYWQSYTWINCFVQGHAGAFVYGEEAYDISVIGGLYQAGGADYAFDLSKLFYGRFWATFVNYQAAALKLNGPKGLDISGYFETNVLDIDFRTGGIPAVGVNIHGLISLVGAVGEPYKILWGEAFGCTSSGNVFYGKGHDLLATSAVDINDHSYEALSNRDARVNIGYREANPFAVVAPGVRGVASALYTWATTNAIYTRNGNRVDLEFFGTLTSTGTNAADALLINSNLPFPARAAGYLCGSVHVVGSAVNNGLSSMEITVASPMQTRSCVNVIPANTSGQSFTVRVQLSYVIG
jgi:hypothetical protein